jgi:monovalent cation:H+ antiporter-2, CPA2 family
MPHSATLISTLVFALVLAFGFGLVARQLRLPPLFGYLLAGIAIGPFTPGIVAD